MAWWWENHRGHGGGRGEAGKCFSSRISALCHWRETARPPDRQLLHVLCPAPNFEEV